MEDGKQDPELTEWDSPDVIRAKLQLKAERNIKG